MSAEIKTCVEFECNGCGDGWSGNDDMGTPHFEVPVSPTQADIRLAAVEKLKDWQWTTTESDEHYCRSCSVERLCAAEGHVWGPWVEAFNYSDPDWKIKPAPAEQRFCDRDYCDGRETRAAGTDGPIL